MSYAACADGATDRVDQFVLSTFVLSTFGRGHSDVALLGQCCLSGFEGVDLNACAGRSAGLRMDLAQGRFLIRMSQCCFASTREP